MLIGAKRRKKVRQSGFLKRSAWRKSNGLDDTTTQGEKKQKQRRSPWPKSRHRRNVQSAVWKCLSARKHANVAATFSIPRRPFGRDTRMGESSGGMVATRPICCDRPRRPKSHHHLRSKRGRCCEYWRFTRTSVWSNAVQNGNRGFGDPTCKGKIQARAQHRNPQNRRSGGA